MIEWVCESKGRASYGTAAHFGVAHDTGAGARRPARAANGRSRGCDEPLQPVVAPTQLAETIHHVRDL